MAAPIQAVIFDVGGVLVTARDRSRHTAWEARLGLEPGDLRREVYASPASLRATLGLATEADVWMELAVLFRLHADEARALAADFVASERVDRRLATFVQALRPRYKTALLSNAWPEARASWSARFALDRLTDCLILSAEEHLAKPDTRIYELATERLNVAPEAALFVDDWGPHVEGARDAGLQAIHYRGRTQTLAELRRLLEDDVGS